MGPLNTIRHSLSRSLSIYSHLSQEIYLLALARFILGCGTFVGPFLSLLLTQKLGYSKFDTGFWVSVVLFAGIPGNLIGGKLSDRYSRKQILLAGQIVAGFGLLLCSFWANQPIILPLLFLCVLSFGIANPSQMALLADLSTPKNRDGVMSLSYLSFNFGFAIGPLIAGYLFVHYLQWMFVLNAAVCFLSVLLIWLWIKEPVRDAGIEHSELERAVSGSVWHVVRERPRLILFTLLCMLLYFILAQVTFSLPIYMAQLFQSKGPQLYGQLMTINGLLVVLFTPVLIQFSRRFFTMISLVHASVLMMIAFTIILLATSYGMIVVGVMFITAAEILLVTKASIYIADQSPSSHRGRINGLLNVMIFCGSGLCPILMGAFIQRFDFQMAWSLIITMSFVVSVLFLWMSHHQIKQNNQCAADRLLR